uniref:Putative site-specific DNA endonuclease n=1 Tax=Tupiella akineta TaxID=160070 RepID=Q3ZIZ1_TUPAK|nr:putative site-specific DNA endonuclease [Tupiella akineta]AAV80698.1 putative site-specific DNA endonuclease [Tupiella akineta]
MLSSKIKEPPNTWDQWFEGLVDADGCLLISSAGYASLEITLDIYEEQALLQIKQELQGSVKLKPKARAFRYRLHHKAGILKAITKLNGLCRNSKRVVQLQKLCQKLSIDFISPQPLNLENAWFAAFFDGDGTVGYSFKNGWPQLIISVSNKNAVDCEPFRQIFGGVLSMDKRSNTYKWSISKKEDIFFFCAYLKKHSLRSHKHKRILLIPEFFKLRQMRAYLHSPETPTYKTWC